MSRCKLALVFGWNLGGVDFSMHPERGPKPEPFSKERMTMRPNQSARFYDILGARILRLQDRLAGLDEDDPRREVIIAILTELDELKRDLAAAGFGDD